MKFTIIQAWRFIIRYVDVHCLVAVCSVTDL